MTAPHWARSPHHELPRGSRMDGLGHDGASLNRRPRVSTAPAGLFAPAPEVVRDKVVKAKSTVGLTQTGNLARQRPCGTETAAKRHKRNGEVDANGQILCAECNAGREARRVQPKPKPKWRPVSGARCGSKLGYDDHLLLDETTCQPCRDAMAADVRRRAALREKTPKTAPTITDQCGTKAGRPAHRRRNEWPCEPCKEAVNAAARGIRGLASASRNAA